MSTTTKRRTTAGRQGNTSWEIATSMLLVCLCCIGATTGFVVVAPRGWPSAATTEQPPSSTSWSRLWTHTPNHREPQHVLSSITMQDEAGGEAEEEEEDDDLLTTSQSPAATTATNQALSPAVSTEYKFTAQTVPQPPLLSKNVHFNDQRYAASDWYQNMRSLPRSTILRATRGPVLAVVVWSTAISCLYKLAVARQWHGVVARLCLSPRPHSFLVSAMGLLLVFRTNSAYQRFAEGRCIWERVHSISRHVSRLALLYERELGAAKCKRVFRLLAAFPYLLHQHIQPEHHPHLEHSPYGLALPRHDKNRAAPVSPPSLAPSTNPQQQQQHQEPTSNSPSGSKSHGKDDILWVDRRSLPWALFPSHALQRCVASANRPLWVCDRLSQELATVPYNDNFTSRERLTFLSQIDKLSQSLGQCERIHQTAVPLNYARHSLRSLTLWLFTLPFTLVQDFGWLTGPVMGFASWLLYGIYQIGYTIEDPFQGSLRLSILCDAIYRDIMDGADSENRRLTAFGAWIEEADPNDNRRLHKANNDDKETSHEPQMHATVVKTTPTKEPRDHQKQQKQPHHLLCGARLSHHADLPDSVVVTDIVSDRPLP